MRRGPYKMLSRMLIGKGFGCWNTMPTMTRSSLGSVAKISRPATSMVPSVRTIGTKSHMRLNVRRSVDLPQPEGPMNAVALFFGISSEMFLSAWKSPYHRLKLRIEMTDSPSATESMLAWESDNDLLFSVFFRSTMLISQTFR